MADQSELGVIAGDGATASGASDANCDASGDARDAADSQLKEVIAALAALGYDELGEEAWHAWCSVMEEECGSEMEQKTVLNAASSSTKFELRSAVRSRGVQVEVRRRLPIAQGLSLVLFKGSAPLVSPLIMADISCSMQAHACRISPNFHISTCCLARQTCHVSKSPKPYHTDTALYSTFLSRIYYSILTLHWKSFFCLFFILYFACTSGPVQ